MTVHAMFRTTQNAKEPKFSGASPHWGGLITPPRLLSCITVFLLTTPQKLLETALLLYLMKSNCCIYSYIFQITAFFHFLIWILFSFCC